MAKSSGLNFNLPSVDDLFSTEEERAEARLEKVVNLSPSEISDFPNHPFKVRMDAAMQEMTESVKQYGVLVPALVRPKPEGGYEMVAGHRRKKAADLAGLAEIPCIVRQLTDDEATIIMVDSNLQREQILPSEKAFAYRDTNGNKELDEGDELLGKLEETSTGIYEMSHILYGGVFVRETKAPEGFLLDENAYYVEITENGKIYEVENEAGIGFTNMAQTGSLRIEKTSSDGKVEGFSFRVTGANGYDQTFKTDKNGEIFIEGLRVGDYTVSEVSDGASANYVLPADKKVTILADKTTVAQMHNELRDTPKTGDDSKPWLWAALMGVSAMGAAALGVAAYVGKRKKDNHTAK